MNSSRSANWVLDRSIVEGPIPRAVWLLAWPTAVQNLIGGLQGVVDHALVGHFVGYAGNAAIGVATQIFIVVIVFVMSVFTGMGVLVARFAGANEPEKVNRTVYQAFLAALALWGVVLAPLGWFLAPSLLQVVNAAPAVLGERRDLALLFKDLATLRTDAPLFREVDELAWRGPTDAFAAYAQHLGDPRLLQRCRRLRREPANA